MIRENEKELIHIVRESEDPAAVAEMLIGSMARYLKGESLDEIAASYGIRLPELNVG